jgi:hypothetical protein
MPGTDTSASTTAPQGSTRASFELLNSRIMGVEGNTHINVDLMYVAMLTRAQVPAIQKIRPELEAKLKDFDASLIDDIDPMSRALQHAHGLYLQATKAPAALQSLVDAGTDLRELLFGEANTLVRRGLINADSIREVKRGPGYRPLILDLQILVQTFRERWAEIKERTGVKPEEIDAAEALVDTLTDAVITKDYSPAAQAHATVVREKAFLLLARTYGEVRDAVIYARRKEGDADLIAPSIYGNRSRRAQAAEESEGSASTADNDQEASAEAKEKGTKAERPAQPSPVANLNAELDAAGQFKRASGEG